MSEQPKESTGTKTQMEDSKQDKARDKNIRIVWLTCKERRATNENILE